MQRSLLAAALICSSTLAYAAPKSVPLTVIKPLVFGYMEATGCPGNELDGKSVIPFADPANGVAKGYLAVISSDLTCAGGSGTSASALVLLRTASGQEGGENELRYLKVDADMSAPVAQVISAPRAITGFQQLGGQLYAHGAEYGPGDANCCPSLKTSYKVALRKDSVGTTDAPRDIYTWVFSKLEK